MTENKNKGRNYGLKDLVSEIMIVLFRLKQVQ